MTPWLPERRLSAQSDDRLAEMARNGHDEAFAAIVRRYHQPMLALARRLCSDGRAEDVVQQTFLSALIAFRTGTEVNHLRGWLHQILRHTAARTAHQPDIELEAEFGNSADSVADAVQRRVATYQVLSALAMLPTRQREAMIATALHGRSRSSVASSMGLSEGAVRQLMHRARRTLRSAAYVLIPWPLLRWVSPGSAPAGDQGPEIAAAAWSSPTPVLATKLLTVVASSVLAIGTLGPHHRPIRRSPRAAPVAGAGPARRLSPPVTPVAVAVSSRGPEVQPLPDTARSARAPGDGVGRGSTGARGSSTPAQSGDRHSSGDGSSSSSGDGGSSSSSGGGFSSSGDGPSMGGGQSGSDGPSGGTPTTESSSPPAAAVAATTDGGPATSGQSSGGDGSSGGSSGGGSSPTTDLSGGGGSAPTTDSASSSGS